MTKQPTFFATEAQAIAALPDVTSTRSRPVLAKNNEGQFIACCKTTAKKYGWGIEGKLYAKSLNRVGRDAVTEAKAATPAAKPATKSVKRLASLEEMLGQTFGKGAVEVVSTKPQARKSAKAGK